MPLYIYRLLNVLGTGCLKSCGLLRFPCVRDRYPPLVDGAIPPLEWCYCKLSCIEERRSTSVKEEGLSRCA